MSQEIEEERFMEKEEIINNIEACVEKGFYTLEEIISETKDRLCHLWE